MRVLNANYQALLIRIGKDQMTKSSENIVHCLKIWRYLDTFNSDALKLVANKSDFALHHIIVSCFFTSLFTLQVNIIVPQIQVIYFGVFVG